LTTRRSTVGLLVAVLVITGLLFSTSFNAGGAGMDEGTLVTYPELVLNGDVPGRDFETFYGPGGPYLLAGAFAVFGHSVHTERAVGLAYKLAIVAALFLLLLPWGGVAAAVGSLASALVMLPLGSVAVDWFGGLAFALLGLALLAWLARREEPDRGWWTAGSGLLSALALAFRPDLAPAVILSALPLWLLLAREGRLRYLAGFVAGLVPTIVWLAVVGPHGLSKLIHHLRTQQSGRSLPVPSPASSAWSQALVASVLTMLATFGTWAYLQWRSVRSFEGRLLLSLGLFSLATLPAALERADDEHLLAYSCVAIAIIPAVVLTVWPLARSAARGPVRTATLVGVALLVVIGAGSVIHVVGVGPTVKSNILGISSSEDEAFVVENDGHSFPAESKEVADGLRRLLPKLDAIAAPGDSVFVGPQDLSRTAYADTFIYHLLPELRPATYYDELNPDVPAGLADELRQADFLLLTSHYEGEEAEEGTAIDAGSTEPNQVVKEDFCEVDSAGSYTLYRRCDLPAAKGAGAKS
jgi:hypothetical protein